MEKAEGQWNAQLARDIIMALPNEIPKDEYEALVRDYCREQFVSRGMIADFAIHDKGDGNPHAHILLTMRAMDEEGKWLPKARKIYDLDENGKRIRLPSGEYKSHKENTTDWDLIGEEIRNENVTPSGSPALVNPMNSGIEEQEQNGVTVPSKAATIRAPRPVNLPRIFLLRSGGK